ncbi:hypothetical protein KIL84_010214 [Mauremys mutica]|uniref:Uncharacterized protein n=1 Tax=Mauremys mutica TaxID=74926 RepID=A0A9D4B6Q9_9SAUR|nr:hypothetical protein KIL84_010214 [Mauremys mutica]
MSSQSRAPDVLRNHISEPSPRRATERCHLRVEPQPCRLRAEPVGMPLEPHHLRASPRLCYQSHVILGLIRHQPWGYEASGQEGLDVSWHLALTARELSTQATVKEPAKQRLQQESPVRNGLKAAQLPPVQSPEVPLWSHSSPNGAESNRWQLADGQEALAVRGGLSFFWPAGVVHVTALQSEQFYKCAVEMKRRRKLLKIKLGKLLTFNCYRQRHPERGRTRGLGRDREKE